MGETKKTMDKQTKSVLVQWIGPFALMLIVLVVMLFNFFTKSKINASDTITKNMVTAAEASARQFKERLVLLETVGRPIASLYEEEGMLDTAHGAYLAEVAKQYSGAYAVYICNEDGEGIDNTGGNISVSGTDYFESLRSSEDVKYTFITHDLQNEESTIMVSIPLHSMSENGYMLLFYPLDNFGAVVKQAGMVDWDAMTLIDAEGTVLITSCSGIHWKQGDNLYSKLEDEDVVRRIKSRINGNLGGLSEVSMKDGDYGIVYIPFGINRWAVITSIQQVYIDEQVNLQWKNARNMVIQLVVVLCIFLCVIIGINIFGKMYNVRKQKQLEEKADTDLLTGLNNKLATERKIKDFIEHNPNSQSMMFILDIDNFKKINDTMGHAFGDEVLRSLGKQIGALFRATDIVGRAGGDEFIVFLKNVADVEAVRKEAGKVERFFKGFKAGEYTKYSATASIGVAIFPKEGANFESIYKAADQALYKAKKRGKNQLAFYNEIWVEGK